MAYAKPTTPAAPGKFYGHSPNAGGTGDWQFLFDHIHGNTPTQPEWGVALMAREFARYFGMEERAFLAGLLHDLGKYAPSFNDHLNGARLKLDHWTAGAFVALRDYHAVDIALVIEGHHIGLQSGVRSGLVRLDLRKPVITYAKNLSLTEPDDHDAAVLKARWQRDLAENGASIPSSGAPRILNQDTNQTSDMAAVRLLFSTLVDADFLDTERHFSIGKKNHTPRPVSPALDAPRALARVREFLDGLVQTPAENAGWQKLRQKLGENCTTAAQTSDGDLLYTLTAPTGSGKTLAMLLFALEKAAREPTRFRRIIVALPYLSILDQTAALYRTLFPADKWGEHYVLEHHSLAGTKQSDAALDPSDNDTDENDVQASDGDPVSARNEARLLTENWDAPIILTTNVQLLESLHASRPSACRKLHNVAGSIILCDEVQTLPAALAIPTLRTLSALATPTYNTAVVFATATQPAFNSLHAEVAKDTGTTGWTPREIVGDPQAMFRSAATLRPVRVDWVDNLAETPWETVAKWLRADAQGMAIVNLRRHSVLLAQLLQAGGTPGLEYISTYLCPAHRREVLGRVNAALKSERLPCRLVATQCVEAGVDLDFPLVCRALGPLDSVAQAAGRCNREGKLPSGGLLRVFRPPSEGKRRTYPDDTYKQAAEKTAGLVRANPDLSLSDPQVFDDYFRSLYVLNDLANQETPVRAAIKSLDFEDTAKHYRLIDKRGINVVVPYKQGEQIGQEITKEGLNRDRVQRARQWTVSVLTDTKAGTPSGLRPVSIARTGENAPDWFVLEDAARYHPVWGYAPNDAADATADENNPPRFSGLLSA